MVYLTDDPNFSEDVIIMNSSEFLLQTTSPPSWLQTRNSSELLCPSQTVQVVGEPTLHRVTFAFGMVLIPSVAAFGTVGNVLSLVVMVQHRMRSTTNLILAALALSDLLLLLHSLAFSAIRIHGLRDPVGALAARRKAYPVLGAYGSIVCARITTWLTALLGVERCVAVYLPMKARSINSRRGTQLAITAIYALTLLAFLPTALQYRVEEAANSTVPELRLSALGRNRGFMVPYSVLLNTVFRFIPLLVVVVVNALIVAAIRRTRIVRRNLSWGGIGGGNNSSTAAAASGREQKHITLMLLTVSGVFLLCTLPGAVNTVVSRINPGYSRLGDRGNLYQTLSIVTYFLETVNSSVNFVIYMTFSRKFNQTYHEIFCCCDRSSPTASSAGQASQQRTVRFVQPQHRLSSGAARLSYEMQSRRYNSLPIFPTSHVQRMRFLSSGLIRSSLDVEDQHLLRNSRGGDTDRTAATANNGSLPLHGSCCTCRQDNNSNRSRSQSHSRSRSRSQSHSSESMAAQQYS